MAEHYKQKYGEVPDYLMEYGDKYARKFAEIEPKLSPEGKKWVRNTMRGLQDKMIEAIEKDPSIVFDSERFRDMAFETHSDAYLEGGLNNVPLPDIMKALDTLGPEEGKNLQTWKEAAEVIPRYFAIENKEGRYYPFGPDLGLLTWFLRKSIDSYLK